MKKFVSACLMAGLLTCAAGAAQVGTIDNNYPGDTEAQAQMLYDLGLFKGTDKGFRATMDERNEKIGYKIREAQVHKVPYMIVIGDKDEEKGIISVRNRKTGETTPMELGEFIEKLDYEVKNKLK